MRTHVPRWTALFLIFVTLIAPLFVAAPAHAQEKSLVWDRFDVDIVVNQDGTFDVAEAQSIRFTAGTFTFGTRTIPFEKLTFIDNWAITDSEGHTYRYASGSEPYTFSVADEGYRYSIRWNFPQLADKTVTYTLRYQVHGGLRYYEGGDQLWWQAIYGDRSFPVLEGRVRVSVPSPAVIDNAAFYVNVSNAENAVSTTVMADNRTAIFDLDRRLNSGEQMEARVQFTPGVVAGSPAAWQADADAATAAQEAAATYRETWGPIATLGLGALGALFLFSGPALLYLLWFKLGRDKPVEMVADYIPEPPDTTPPGMVGALLDEQVDMEDILSTLVDLAQRKIISITEEATGTILRSKDFVYRLERAVPPELLPYEKMLLDSVFGKKHERRLSDLKNSFYTELPKIKKVLYEDITEAGYFTRNPESVRTQYGCLGGAALALAAVVGIVLLGAFGDLTAAAILPGFGLGVTAIGLVILARFMPRKTDQGSESAAKWQAFRTYLKDIEKYSDLEQQKAIWDRWLPYAIAFGFEKNYIRKFEQVQAPAPGWYIPGAENYGPYRRRYYGGQSVGGPVTDAGKGIPGMGMPRPAEGGGGLGGGLGDMSGNIGTSLAGMSAGLGGMLSSASNTFTSRPASTSSSGGGWSGGSSGGGGFSGGGSFGGGGGGGGGGGFG